MVLTVTLNPLLEKRLFFNKVKTGHNNRALKEEYKAGGKGINVSRQLNKLGIQNLALTFLGGANGKKLRSILEFEKINFSSVSIKSETREACLVVDKSLSQLTTYFGINSNITKQEIESFKTKLEKSVINSSTVVFAGSAPTNESSEIFAYGIELCNKYDKISVLDTYGPSLENLLMKKPTVVHNNIEEIESSLNLNLKSEKSKLEYLNFLYNTGIKLSFLTAGKNPTYASKFNFDYKVKNPEIKLVDATGSGDSFLAGIVYGLEKSMVFENFVKLASALGAVNAERWETSSVDFHDAVNISNNVEVTTIGKKMKILDDSPTI